MKRRRPSRVRESPHEYSAGTPARLLLDTHVLLWWATDDSRVSRAVGERIASASEVFLSAASAWEIGIKARLGKLRAPSDTELPAELARRGVVPLSITMEHALAAAALPPLHRDPFDRMIVAQARLEGLTLVTADPALARYGVPIMRARA